MSDPLSYEMIIDEARKAEENKGTLENPDISQHDANPMCGDDLTLQIKIKDNTINDIKWDGKGCTVCTACTGILTQLVKGKDIDYVKNFKKEEILSELGLEHLIKQSPVRIKCALLSLKVLKYGMYSYLAKRLKDSSEVDKLKEEAASLY
jgi:nitrogen fixation NifU-like protein